MGRVSAMRQTLTLHPTITLATRLTTMALGPAPRFMGVIDIPTTPLSAATSPLSLSGVISGPRIAANAQSAGAFEPPSDLGSAMMRCGIQGT
jgi:hypothetical protein